MARRSNELFIGREYMNREGTSNKHPALISLYANVNANKISEDPIDVEALDIETDAKTGEMKLLGVYGESYRFFTENFLSIIEALARTCMRTDKALAYWNKLDPLVIYRVLLNGLPDKEARYRSLVRFGKVCGEWNKEDEKWDVKPVIELEFDDGYIFGIKQVIRSSIQFFMKAPAWENIETVWAFDIAQLFPSHLAEEAKRFDWYSKVDESAHEVDWERFWNEKHYREEIVLKSNFYDAKACKELAVVIQEDFKAAFGFYPRTLISQGSLARSAVAAALYKRYEYDHTDEKELMKKVAEEMKSIGFMSYYDDWAEKYGKETVKDIYCMSTEAYSGGYIDSIRYGYAKKGWYADIASAYPAVIAELDDLRGARVEGGKGEPPRPKHGYVLIRGTVTIPKHIHYHPLTVKHPLYPDTNIRPVGTFKGAYLLEERDYLKERGATFQNEEWYVIETSGNKSALAGVCNDFIELRKRLKEQGSSSEYMAKIAANSLYGILYEAVDTHKDETVEKTVEMEHKDDYYIEILSQYKNGIDFGDYVTNLKSHYDSDFGKVRAMWHSDDGIQPDVVAEELKSMGMGIKAEHPADIVIEIDGLYRMHMHKHKAKVTVYEEEVVRNGYRAGEFWNPIYAAIITARTRLTLAKAADAIEKKGGKPIVLMTDSITWQGDADMLPRELVKEQKTLGYFEPPEEVKDIVCLGTGRYGYKYREGGEWKEESKKRGLNARNLHDPASGELNAFSWVKALDIMREAKTSKIDVNVRLLVSVGIILHRNELSEESLGRIVDEKRNVDALVGMNKRHLLHDLDDIETLTHSLVDTEPVELLPAMFGVDEVPDQTYPVLRGELMKKVLVTKNENRKNKGKKRVAKYYAKNRAAIRSDCRRKYAMLKRLGFNASEATRYSNWSDASIDLLLQEKGIEKEE